MINNQTSKLKRNFCGGLCCRTQSFPHYRMDHHRRGIAAIFNHEVFDNSGFSERKGSRKDVDSLCQTFARLGFEVETFCDLTYSEIQTAVEELSQRDHSKCDCFVLVFMSHGLEGKLRSRDVVFDVNCLWDCFTPHQAPSLANKPKIFIIQACQGHGRQCGVRVEEEVEEGSQAEDTVTLVPGYTLPLYPDFLIALSTIPGFVSWRSPQNGSWYIQTLCQHLNRHGFEQDLVTLLTHVGREIAIEYAVEEDSLKKQLPSIISLLVKKVLFTKKGNRRKGVSGAMSSRDSLDDGVREKQGKDAEQDVSKRRKKNNA